MFSSGFLNKNLQFSISPCILIYDIEYFKANMRSMQQKRAVFCFYILLRLYSRNYIREHQHNCLALMCFS
jgi:hypothetical protein